MQRSASYKATIKTSLGVIVMVAAVLLTHPIAIHATSSTVTSCTCYVDGFQTACPFIDTTGYPQADCGYLGDIGGSGGGGGGPNPDAAPPDLTPVGSLFFFSPLQIQAGQEYSGQIIITNQGGLNTSDARYDDIVIDAGDLKIVPGVVVRVFLHPTSGASAGVVELGQYTMAFPLVPRTTSGSPVPEILNFSEVLPTGIPAGTYRLAATVDATNILPETDETNNSKQADLQEIITVTSFPDLIPTAEGLVVTPGSPVVGAEFEITAKVLNTGAQLTASSFVQSSQAGTFYVRFRAVRVDPQTGVPLEDTLGGTVLTPPVAVSVSELAYGAFSPPIHAAAKLLQSGNYALYMDVDIDPQHPEDTTSAGRVREGGPDGGEENNRQEIGRIIIVDCSQLPPDEGDEGTTEVLAPPASGSSCSQFFTLSGKVEYDFIPVNTRGLDFASKHPQPVRRAILMPLSNGSPIISPTTGSPIETMTDDEGTFTLDIPAGTTVTLRVFARTKALGYLKDGVGGPSTEHCHGAMWDVWVGTSTPHFKDSNTTFAGTTTNASILAETLHDSVSYSSRNGAPFALLDSILLGIEFVCQANTSLQYFPALHINWSEHNGGGVSFYQDDTSQLFILGVEDEDTDEYDRHVVLHEFGHYLLDQLFGVSYDATVPGLFWPINAVHFGGKHDLDDMLDPVVAFSEGFGLAFAGMVLNDPVYTDTYQDNGQITFTINLGQPPQPGAAQGIYNEHAVAFFLFQLQQNLGSFTNIYDMLFHDMQQLPAPPNLHTFAAFYNEKFGGASGNLSTLWSDRNLLNGAYDALCVGPCAGSPTQTGAADPFDTDNNLGKAYAGRTYIGDRPRDAGFWALYRELKPGYNPASSTDGHFVTVDGLGGTHRPTPSNKLGNNRWFYYRATRSETVTIMAFNAFVKEGDVEILLDCQQFAAADPIDIFVFETQTLVASRQVFANDPFLAGCPYVQFPAVVGKTYVILIRGIGHDLTRFTLALGGGASPLLSTTSFSLSSAPSSLVQLSGGTATVPVGITRASGFPGSVTLQLVSPHNGITGSFSPASTAGTSSTFTLTIAGNVPPGTYTLTVQGTSYGVTKNTTLVLTVKRFLLSLSAPDVVLASGLSGGSSDTVTVTITRGSGFTSAITLSLQGSPSGSGIGYSFNPVSTTGNSSTLKVTASRFATPGDYLLTVRGTDATGLSETIQLGVFVEDLDREF